MRKPEERKFQKIYENIATGISLTNLDGFFEECNAAYSALTGYSQDELRKMQFSSLIHPDDLDEIKDQGAAGEARTAIRDRKTLHRQERSDCLGPQFCFHDPRCGGLARSDHRARRRHHKPDARAASRASYPEIV